MEPWELEQLILRLTRAHAPTAGKILFDLEQASRELWCDERHRARIRAASMNAGVDPPRLSESAPLAVGEAWLLLYGRDAGEGEVARIRSDPGGDAKVDFESAYRGLRAMCGRLGRAFPSLEAPLAFRVWPATASVVDGRSLGLAACAALLSRRLGVAPRDDTAASAIVDSEGRLRPVGHLDAKVRALMQAHPKVRRVVVAKEQEVGHLTGLELIRRVYLEEALPDLGLDPQTISYDSLRDHLQRVESFKLAGQGQRDSEDWMELAREAWETMHALLKDEPRLAADAAGYAALFSLHAGDGSIFEKVREVLLAYREEIPDEPQAWLAVVEATHRIDAEIGKDPVAAVAVARDALERCRNLEGNREALLGMALGTYGRACLHAGQVTQAEPVLREAYEHHLQFDGGRVARGERARSGCYLATCLRLLSRADEALTLVTDELAYCDRFRRWPLPHGTIPFLSLEHGRCLLALDHPGDALTAFKPAAESATHHPRVSALRGMAEAHRRLGNDGAAWGLTSQCMRMASELEGREILARVSLLAVGDAILVELTESRRQQLRQAWLSAYPSDEPAAVTRELERWLY